MPKLRTERPRKTKIDTEVPGTSCSYYYYYYYYYVTRTPLSRSKVKITRRLYSPPC